MFVFIGFFFERWHIFIPSPCTRLAGSTGAARGSSLQRAPRSLPPGALVPACEGDGLNMCRQKNALKTDHAYRVGRGLRTEMKRVPFLSVRSRPTRPLERSEPFKAGLAPPPALANEPRPPGPNGMKDAARSGAMVAADCRGGCFAVGSNPACQAELFPMHKTAFSLMLPARGSCERVPCCWCSFTENVALCVGK